MKPIRFLLCLALFAAAFVPVAYSAEPLTASEKRLVGIWEEYAPSSNVVQFYPNHTMRIYLTKEEGTKMNKHWIEASWKVSPDDNLTLKFDVNGKIISETAKLAFEDKQMWLTQKTGVTTKSRAVAGDVPEKYRW